MTLLAAVPIGIMRLRNLFGVVVLTAVYSFVMASVLLVLDAVDVAMTEASVGAGISAVLMLSALYLTRTEEARPVRSVLMPLLVCGATAALLLWAVGAGPDFGIGDSPVQIAGPDYLARSLRETGIPNVVTAVLASYRGLDTFGEATVIFAAGIGVLLLLKRRISPPSGEEG